MADHHRGRPQRFQAAQGGDQVFFPCLVQIRAGLVQNHQHRIVVHRPGQADPLPLPTRQIAPRGSDLGFIPPGELEDGFVGLDRIGRGKDPVRVRDLHPGDVFTHGPREELDILGEVAQRGSEFLLVPGKDIQPVQENLP